MPLNPNNLLGLLTKLSDAKYHPVFCHWTTRCHGYLCDRHNNSPHRYQPPEPVTMLSYMMEH